MAISDNGTEATSRARLSLYAAFRLARILLDVKERFKSRLKARSLSSKSLTLSHRDTFIKDNAYEEITRALNVRSRTGTLVHPRCRRTQAQGQEVEISTLLQKLDSHADASNDKISSIAAHDQRFLEYDPQRAATTNDASMLRLLDLTTLLLDRLQVWPGNHAMNHRKINQSDCDYLKCEKFIANLEHLLRCLQQAIVQALIRNTLKLIDADIVHSHTGWELRCGDREGWFAEWPNGQPPLNTTWPWNVKPSLIVLWGVCWMFYDRNNQVNQDQGDNNNHHPHQDGDGWMTTHGSRQGISDNNLWTGPVLANFSQDQNTPGAWWDPSGSALLPLASGERATIGSDSDSYALSQDFVARASGLNIQGSYTSLPNPYIINSLAEHSTLLPASSETVWPYLPVTSIASTPYPTVVPWPHPVGHHPQQQQQQQQHDQNQQEPRPTQPTNSHQQGADGLLVSDLEPQQTLNQQTLRREQKPPQTRGSNNPNIQLIVPPQDMTPYLPSPHSDSGRSTCMSTYPVSPKILANAATSSTGGSPPSGQEGSARSMEPRNEDGLLYCTHQDCMNEGRIFQRKCEYQKHMDKHNRPYICDEPGCEKIQGFTYSGGLLRHQREVHRQHGGPKASCMCPHRDCKRSTGVGFSRKENLYEHLRRVHRGVGDERDPQQAAATAPVSSSSPLRPVGSETGSRKRRRTNQEDDDDDDEGDDDAVKESRDLRKQVKRLRSELQEKDERLKRLEQAVERLSGGRLPGPSA